MYYAALTPQQFRITGPHAAAHAKEYVANIPIPATPPSPLPPIRVMFAVWHTSIQALHALTGTEFFKAANLG